LTKRFARANWPALNALEKANAPKEAEEKEPAEPKN
jgi:hypothetical protein